MSMTPEKRVQNKIEKYLDELIEQGYPIIYDRRNAIGLNYKKGSADLWMSFNGQHIEIEVKQPGGFQSTMQEKWEKKCKCRGIMYLLIDNIDEFKGIVNVLINNLKNKVDLKNKAL